MKLKEFSNEYKNNEKEINDISNIYFGDTIDYFANELHVDKTVAKYLITKALTSDLIKSEIFDNIDYLNENELIFEDDQ